MPFLESAPGNLYFAPETADTPSILVRRFDGDFDHRLIAAWADLNRAAVHWIGRDAELAALVKVAEPLEVGRDFIARYRIDGTSLAAFADEEDPPPPPDELAPMQTRFRALASSVTNDDEAMIATVLARSLLAPTYRRYMTSARNDSS